MLDVSARPRAAVTISSRVTDLWKTARRQAFYAWASCRNAHNQRLLAYLRLQMTDIHGQSTAVVIEGTIITIVGEAPDCAKEWRE
jgi:hypothetical protein